VGRGAPALAELTTGPLRVVSDRARAIGYERIRGSDSDLDAAIHHETGFLQTSLRRASDRASAPSGAARMYRSFECHCGRLAGRHEPDRQHRARYELPRSRIHPTSPTISPLEPTLMLAPATRGILVPRRIIVYDDVVGSSRASIKVLNGFDGTFYSSWGLPARAQAVCCNDSTAMAQAGLNAHPSGICARLAAGEVPGTNLPRRLIAGGHVAGVMQCVEQSPVVCDRMPSDLLQYGPCSAPDSRTCAA